MTTTLTAEITPSPSLSAGAIFKAGLTGGAIAALLNMALYGAARAAGVDFVAKYDPNAAPSGLPFFLPAVSSLVPSLFAALVMLGFTKVLAKPAVPFAVLSGVLAIASLGGPANLVDANTGTKVVLALMHFVAAAAIAAPLYRVAQRR